MKLKKTSLLLVFGLSTNLSFARSVGADFVICRDSANQIKSAELLDYYEGRIQTNIKPAFESQLNHEMYFSAVYKKLEGFDANSNEHFSKYQEILDALRTIRSNGDISNNANFLVTDDHLATDAVPTTKIPAQCEIERVVTLQEKKFPNDPSYIIQKDLIRALSEEDLRGLILHIGIHYDLLTNWHYWKYEDIWQKGIDFSSSSRLLVFSLASKKLSDLKFEYFVESIKHIYKVIKNHDIGNIKVLPNGKYLFVKQHSAVIFDDNGAMDLELTKKYGYAEVRYFIRPEYENWGPEYGDYLPRTKMTVIDSKQVRKDVRLKYPWLPEKFSVRPGIFEVEISLAASTSKAELDFGIKEGEYIFKKVTPGQTVRGKFEVYFDDSYRWRVKCLEEVSL